MGNLKSNSNERKSIFSIKIPLLYTLLLLGLVGGVAYYYNRLTNIACDEKIEKAVGKIESASVRILFESEYKLIKPLAFVDFTKEDTLLLGIKEEVNDFIQEEKQQGIVSSVSVYIRNLNRHQDVRINPSELYFPGSLMKIPIMITYLKESERHPEILSKKVAFLTQYDNLPFQNIKSEGIKLGESYTIRQLMEYMITHSDNNATALLGENIPFEKIARVFSDLQLPYPDPNKPDYSISLKDYSRFFRVLFNSTYLSWENSEYALNLLTKTDYKNGILKGVEPGTIVAHKFGERNSDGTQQLHEIGIVYLEDKPYLIGIMTKGREIPKMEQAISGISKIVYEGMKTGKADE